MRINKRSLYCLLFFVFVTGCISGISFNLTTLVKASVTPSYQLQIYEHWTTAGGGGQLLSTTEVPEEIVNTKQMRQYVKANVPEEKFFAVGTGGSGTTTQVTTLNMCGYREKGDEAYDYASNLPPEPIPTPTPTP